MTVQCTNRHHDHFEPDDGIADRPLKCRDCGKPAHYNTHLDAYLHDDPADTPCFLIRATFPEYAAARDDVDPAAEHCTTEVAP